MDLKLRYVKHLYGPYAHNLNKVLEILEGHYIRGYGDTQKPDIEIKLLQDADKEADSLILIIPDLRLRKTGEPPRTALGNFR